MEVIEDELTARRCEVTDGLEGRKDLVALQKDDHGEPTPEGRYLRPIRRPAEGGGQTLTGEIDGDKVDIWCGGESHCGQPRPFEGLGRGMINLKDVEMGQQIGASEGEGIQSCPKDDVLLYPMPHSFCQRVLGIAGAGERFRRCAQMLQGTAEGTATVGTSGGQRGSGIVQRSM